MKAALRILLMIVLMIGLTLLAGCDISKRALKTKTDRTLNETTETKTIRKGDTIRYTVPKITYKDTTIVKKNYVTGTTQIVRYDDKGDIKELECISGVIEEFTRSNKLLIEAIKDKDKTTEHQFDATALIWTAIGLGSVIMLVLAFMFWIFLKQFKGQADVLAKVLDRVV